MRIIETIGINIRELRLEKQLTQRDLGKIIGTTEDTISLWERGLRAPCAEMLYQLAQFFNVSVDYLFGLDKI
ncbi:MAG: helix-turn-helix transcriptional regulator [Clostridia bacterium]|nr:helix-turn-helix transcriptional regulator [Clostridia bacterium]